MTSVKGYPMLIEIGEDDERCLRLNIPEDDDAHMVFLAIPSKDFDNDGGGDDDDAAASSKSKSKSKSPPSWAKNFDALEKHFLGQMHELTQRRTKNEALLRKFPVKPPADVQASMDDFLSSGGQKKGGMKSGCRLRLTNPKSTNEREMEIHWFTPLVVNHVRRAVRTDPKDRESSPLEGYSACFENDNDDPVHIIVDSVMVSEGPEYDDDDAASEDPAFQGHHLNPLADLLGESISSAKTVINEMHYMERREARMRVTAESINSRVRFFSYISIGILFVVTYLQVAYLKRYFRKKKLL
eukprot:jgi/Psemu1/239039/estExt_Genewise1.C_1240042